MAGSYYDEDGNRIEEVEYLHDDFDAVVANARERRSGMSNAVPIDSSWAQLVRGKTIGKALNLEFTAATSASSTQSGAIDILDVSGEDHQATQFCLTLGIPEIYDGIVGAVTDLQTLQGSQDNISLVNTFPFGGNVGGLISGVRNDRAFGNPVAIVEWGAGGVRNRVEADFLNGLCLNLVGSFCRVRAFVDGNGISPGFANAFYKLGAALGPGFPKPNNAQRTIMLAQATAINTESAQGYTVPRFAKSVYVCGANGVHDVFVGTIRFYRTPNCVADNSFVADYVFAGNSPQPIIIPNGAYYFTLVPGIANCVSMQAVFQLAV